MEASRRARPGSSTAHAVDGRSAVADVRGNLTAVGRLIERCSGLGLRAPELALVLGERAAGLAEAAGADEQWVRAEGLVVSARVRLGDRAGMVGRAVAALRAAEHAGYGDVAARLRVDLAVCARSVGQPLTGIAALLPVLADPALPTVDRAAALCHLVGCLAQYGRKAELDRVLAEADKLVLGDDTLAADTKLLVRALLRIGVSAHRRRHGDLTAAADAARTGLGFLEKLDRPSDDGGLVRVRLILQLVCTLLDRGDTEMALGFAQPTLAAPVRAGGVAPVGWLRLAVATRIHLPAGSGEAATTLVREAVASTEGHGLHALTSRLWLELSQIEERFGRVSEAMDCLHRSRAAEHLHARVRRQACGLLGSEFGTAELASVDLADLLKTRPAKAVAAPAPVREPVPAPRVEREETVVRQEPRRPEPERVQEAAARREPRFEREEAVAHREPAVQREPRVEREEAVAHREPRVEREEAVAYREAAPRAEPERVPEPVARREPRFEREEAVSYREAVAPREPRREPVAEDRRPEVPEVPVPDLPMAPAPAAEPAPRVTREVRVPEPAQPRWETDEQPARREPVVPAARTTRHDSEHGSVAARSVLDRLGIAGSGGPVGGRRRASDEGPEPGRPPAWSDLAEDRDRRDEPSRRTGWQDRDSGRADDDRGYRFTTDADTGRDNGSRRTENPGLGRSGHEDIDRERGFSPAEPASAPAGNGHGWSPDERDRLDSDRGRPWSTELDRHGAARPTSGAPDRLDFESDRTPSWSADPGTGNNGTGGRRRADERRKPEPLSEPDVPWRSEPPLAPPPREDPVAPAEPAFREQVADPWLPRLRMPPSLDPIDDDLTWTPRSELFGDNSYARAVAEDEPPPDAGLAELLARALAEHQAGTASAAALFKQLGPKDDRADERRPVNGHSRIGDPGDSGRHRTGE